jgi:hypothetical protein
MTDTDNTWQLDPQVRYRRIFDEGVVVHQQKAEALVLNEVGVSFLELCDGERSVQQIIDLMAEQYETTVDVLSRDVREFVVELGEAGVITPV